MQCSTVQTNMVPMQFNNMHCKQIRCVHNYRLCWYRLKMNRWENVRRLSLFQERSLYLWEETGYVNSWDLSPFSFWVKNSNAVLLLFFIFQCDVMFRHDLMKQINIGSLCVYIKLFCCCCFSFCSLFTAVVHIHFLVFQATAQQGTTAMTPAVCPTSTTVQQVTTAWRERTSL